MDWAAIFGTIAAVFTSVRFVPQLYQSLMTRHTLDLSLTFLYFVSAQSIFLILYGIAKPDNYILYMNVFPLACAAAPIILKLRYK